MGNTKKFSKGMALGAFYALALVLALLLIFHNNPLEDADTAMLKKICGCVLIGISCILVFFWYDTSTTDGRRSTAAPSTAPPATGCLWRVASPT